MSNLVIGDTSQLSYYFPKEYIKISSRQKINNNILSNNWESVYICVGESRKFLSDIQIYDKINFELTLSLINQFKKISKKVVVYSTCELWNRYSSKINLNLSFDFYSSPYLNSKLKLTNYVLNNKKDYNNVIVLFPFNFNSIFRSSNFLFGKIFDSIINKKRIEIGNTYFYRDIVHPKFIVEKSILANDNEILGSGRLVFVNDFIRDLYKFHNMNYNDFIYEDSSKFIEYEKINEYYLDSQENLYPYNKLLSETIEDINKFKLNN